MVAMLAHRLGRAVTFRSTKLRRVVPGIVVLAVALAGCTSTAGEPTMEEPTKELGVMSFNIWRNGGRSLAGVTDAIRRSGADVIGLQECNRATAETIARDLGFHLVHDERTNAIVSRLPAERRIGISSDVWGGFGATLLAGGGRRIHVFDVHLFWDVYGPYHLQDGTPEDVIVAQENARRMPGLEEVLALMSDALASGEPTFLVGDFNAPSHLDYASFPWPESLACAARGLVDSYRELHPENRTYPGPFAADEPGVTWTPIVEEEARGAFDRIDFVYHAGSAGSVTPLRSSTLDERNSVTPWPSDHRAVVTRFSVRWGR
jgi:endonuclease/exonuclease/phosphatase (EEP) superfamily protein YafD